MYTKDQLAQAWEIMEKRYEGTLGFLRFESFCEILDDLAKKSHQGDIRPHALAAGSHRKDSIKLSSLA